MRLLFLYSLVFPFFPCVAAAAPDAAPLQLASLAAAFVTATQPPRHAILKLAQRPHSTGSADEIAPLKLS
jgi:hypothetical protein